MMMKNFCNLVKKINRQVQEVQRVAKKMNPKRSTPRHNIIKIQKFKTKRYS